MKLKLYNLILLIIFFTILINNDIFSQTFKMVENFETHNWFWLNCGDDIGELVYSTDWKSEGNSSIKLTSTKASTGWNIFETNCLELESIDSMKMDVYAVDSHRLEVKVVNETGLDSIVGALNMSASTVYLNWKIDFNNRNVKKIYLVQAWYTGTVTVYVDNIRAYKDGVEIIWDRCEIPQNRWISSGDAYNYKYAITQIDGLTHNKKSGNFNSTASQVMEWNADSSSLEIAKLQTNFVQPKDWSDYYYFRMDVYRPAGTPDCDIYLFIWDGANGTGTEWVKVPEEKWTTVTMKIGQNINMSNIVEMQIVVPNTDIYTSGKFYFDNLQVGGFIPNSNSIDLASIGVKYSLDDFDGRIPDENQKDSVVRAGYNDYFGYTGTAKSSSASIDASLSNIENNGYAHTKPFAWKISYDVSYDIDTWISYWNLLNPKNPANPKDMSDMDKFSIWIKGDGTNYSNRVCVEFHDSRWGNPDYTSGKAFAVLSGINTDWQQWVIPFDPDSLVVYGSFDPTQVTEVVVSLDNSTASKTSGQFYIDNLQFVDTDMVFWESEDFDDDFLDLVERRTYNYFYECVDDNTGLTFDRVNFTDLASSAGTGFGIGAMVIAAERGWISRQEAENYIVKVLSNLWNTPQGNDITGVNGFNGFFYHFLDAATGTRKQVEPGKAPVELSVVDTGILMAGILLAREYFDDNQTIVDLAEKLYRRVDWTWFYDKSVNQFHLGWSPENGFTGHWDTFTDEVMLINILAIGSPTHPVPSNAFYAWTRDVGEYNNHTIVNSWNGSLFQYFFTHCWIDLHGKKDAQGIDWFNNSVQAGYANRDYCIAGIDGSGRSNVPTYSANSWGLTATEQIPAGIDTFYFGENGALPMAESDYDPTFNGTYFGANNGTVPPYGAVSMIGFAAYSDGFNRDYVFDALKNYYLNTQLWTGNYGFRDSYTDTANVKTGAWSKYPMYKNNMFGIDQGPMLLMIENYRSKLIWNYLGKNDYIQYALNEIFVPDLRVNDDLNGATQLSPATSSNNYGKYVTVWNDRREENKNYIYIQEFHTENKVGLFRVDGINKKAVSIDSNLVKPKVAVNNNSRYLITWYGDNNIYSQTFLFNDTSSGNIIQINDLPIYSNEQSSAVASSNYGIFPVTWTGTDNGKDIYYQLVDSLGVKIGSNVKVNDDNTTTDQKTPDIAIADDGTFVIVWEDMRFGTPNIFGQIFQANGTAIGNNFKISGSYVCSIKPAVVMNGSGEFVVTWLDTSSSQRKIYASVYDKTGTLKAGILTVSSNYYGPAICTPDAAIDSSGAFVIVWQDSREGSMDIYYQKYLVDGTALGDNTRVHSQRLESNQISPAITYLGGQSGFQIVWQDDRNGDWDIYCPITKLEKSNDTIGDPENSELPSTYELLQNYPNPFNPTTTINYSIPKSQNVRIVVYDVLGREVKTLVDDFKESGYYKVVFDASSLTSGLYIYRLVAGNYIQSKKMLLIK